MEAPNLSAGQERLFTGSEGLAWIERSSEGILPSKYKTPEEREAFRKRVEKVTKGANNFLVASRGGFPWNPNVGKK